MHRIDWNNMWMNVALEVAKRSYDPKLKVGCIIISMDNTEVYGFGYNGNAAGLPNERESLDAGKSGFIHAEVNAAIKCKMGRSVPKKVYCNILPCSNCAKCLINLGVNEIYYKLHHQDDSCIEMFKTLGIIVVRME